MDYSRLTDEEAEDILRKHDEAQWDDRLWNEVIEPADVLYWLDAFGDQSLAINCQGLPKDLPTPVVRGVNELDVLNGWNGEHTVLDCPTCRTELHEFGWGRGGHRVMSEYGDIHDFIGYLSESSGQMYDAVNEHRLMCQGCAESTNETFGRWNSYQGVTIFYGQDNDDSYYKFRHTNGIVSRDCYGDHSGTCVDRNVRNEWSEEYVSVEEIERAFAAGRSEKQKLIEVDLNFCSIGYDELDVKKRGVGRAENDVQEIMQDWAEVIYDPEIENCHPDLPFVHIIEDGKRMYCPQKHRDKLEFELKWSFYQKNNQQDDIQRLKNEAL
jgi:hypothetical protein